MKKHLRIEPVVNEKFKFGSTYYITKINDENSCLGCAFYNKDICNYFYCHSDIRSDDTSVIFEDSKADELSPSQIQILENSYNTLIKENQTQYLYGFYLAILRLGLNISRNAKTGEYEIIKTPCMPDWEEMIHDIEES